MSESEKSMDLFMKYKTFLFNIIGFFFFSILDRLTNRRVDSRDEHRMVQDLYSYGCHIPPGGELSSH